PFEFTPQADAFTNHNRRGGSQVRTLALGCKRPNLRAHGLLRRGGSPFDGGSRSFPRQSRRRESTEGFLHATGSHQKDDRPSSLDSVCKFLPWNPRTRRLGIILMAGYERDQGSVFAMGQRYAGERRHRDRRCDPRYHLEGNLRTGEGLGLLAAAA